MSDEIETLSKELSALSDEDLNQIAGSGDKDFVNITDSQCEKVKEWYKLRPSLVLPHCRVVTNYGGPCSRFMFEQAVRMDDNAD